MCSADANPSISQGVPLTTTTFVVGNAETRDKHTPKLHVNALSDACVDYGRLGWSSRPALEETAGSR